jgi:hypothetical protein
MLPVRRETDRLVMICMGISKMTGTRDRVKLITEVILARDTGMDSGRLTPQNNTRLSGQSYASIWKNHVFYRQKDCEGRNDDDSK